MYKINVTNTDKKQVFTCNDDKMIDKQLQELKEGKREYLMFREADDTAEITVIINPAHWGSVLLHKL